MLATTVSVALGMLVGGWSIHAIDPFFPFADLPDLGISPPPELVERFRSATFAFHSQNLAVNLGLMGLTMGLAIGLGTTHYRRWISGICGALCGASGGAITGYFLGMQVASAVIESADQSLVQAATVHFASWAGLLVPISIVVGSLQDGVQKALLNYAVLALLLSVIGGVCYIICGSLFVPETNLLFPIPKNLAGRAIWLLCSGIPLAIGLGLGLRDRRRLPAKTEV